MTQEPIFDWWETAKMRIANVHLEVGAHEADIGADSLGITRNRHAIQRLVADRKRKRDLKWAAVREEVTQAV